jgi:hypothetical protein
VREWQIDATMSGGWMKREKSRLYGATDLFLIVNMLTFGF